MAIYFMLKFIFNMGDSEGGDKIVLEWSI